MSCQVCKTNPASIHLREIKDNLVSEVHLCQACFQQRNEAEAGADESAPSLQLAASLDHASDFRARQEEAGKADLTCSGCGLVFREFLEQGRLGCAQCYSAFGEELRPYLLKIHGATAHKGKAPRQETKSLDMRATLSRLQADLDRAITAEHYELAASLRDQIRAYESDAVAERTDA